MYWNLLACSQSAVVYEEERRKRKMGGQVRFFMSQAFQGCDDPANLNTVCLPPSAHMLSPGSLGILPILSFVLSIESLYDSCACLAPSYVL